MRLFPANQSLESIYTGTFKVYAKSQTWADERLPGLSTFKRASRDPMFSDVKRRPKHRHLRCDTCDELSKRRVAAFIDREVMDQYRADHQRHEADVMAWRQLETIIAAGCCSQSC